MNAVLKLKKKAKGGLASLGEDKKEIVVAVYNLDI